MMTVKIIKTIIIILVTIIIRDSIIIPLLAKYSIKYPINSNNIYIYTYVSDYTSMTPAPSTAANSLRRPLQAPGSPSASGRGPQNYRQTRGKPWENHGKTMGKSLENHGKTMGKSLDNGD